MEFKKEEKDLKPHHLRRQHKIYKDLEAMNQKIAQIEENLIYYFQKLGIDPENVPPSKPDDNKPEDQRLKIKVKDIEEAVDYLNEKVSDKVQHLREDFANLSKFEKNLDESANLVQIFQFLELFGLNHDVFGHLNQLEMRFYIAGANSFRDIEVSLEHEEIPVIFEYDILENEDLFFLIIYQKGHQKSIANICANAQEIKNVEHYFQEKHNYVNELNHNMEVDRHRIIEAEEAIENAKIPEEQALYRSYMEILANCKKFLLLEGQFREQFRTEIVHLKAFVPAKNQQEVCDALDARFHKDIHIRIKPLTRYGETPPAHETSEVGNDEDTYDYDYDDEILAQEEIQVPSLIEPAKIFKPFRLLVSLYGTPNYREMDPTPIVALTYPILFGLMFGDVGHGLVLILAGMLLIIKNRHKKDSGAYDGGFLLVWLGVAAAFVGVLYGEYFGYPIFPALFTHPLHDVGTILKFAILIGVIHITVGWAISAVNHIQNGKKYLALVDSFMKIAILLGGTYMVFVHRFVFELWLAPDPLLGFPAINLVIFPTLGLMFGKPIGRILGISYLKKHSMGELVGEQAVEVGETFLSILSNVASYSRILALTMAHLGLMLIITDLIGSAEMHWIFTSIFLVLGNIFVIVLEAFLAAIHALRLTFYEFFNKFYAADGVVYSSPTIAADYSELEFE
ncbi:MAG: V-type ATP synthase subunit I [Promethearchaeota archaeon]